MHIKKGDLVKVITGGTDRKDKVGRVIEVCRKTGRVRVEGIALHKKHLKPQRNPKHPEGGIVEVVGSIHASNVMLMSEALGRPVRTGQALDTSGKKNRVVRGRNLKQESI